MSGNKGLRFEDLVQDLLQEMYPGTQWNKTKMTHDGKKDFVADVTLQGMGKTDKFWAECKNYDNTTSINVFSPTLVMAVIENINHILFFSYSNLNRNGRKYLAQFGDKTGKDIGVIDDKTLEDQILMRSSILDKYFPDYDPSEIVTGTSDLQIDAQIAFGRDVEWSYSERGVPQELQEKQKNLRVNETFYLDVFLSNPENRLRTIQLKLVPDEYCDFFALLNQDLISKRHVLEFDIDPFGLHFIRLIFRFEKYVAKVALPKVHLFENDQEIKILSAGNIYGSWIIDAPLTGSSYWEIPQSVKKATSHRSVLSAHILHGESGTGKSRLIKEIKDVLMANGYKIFSYDGDFKSTNSKGVKVIKRIISELSGLPIRSPFVSDPSDYNGSYTSDKVAQFLYDEHASLETSYQAVGEMLVELLKGKSTAILIDNIQFYDDDLSLFINHFISEYQDSNLSLTLVACFNTDYLLEHTKAFDLFDRLRRLSIQTSSRFFEYKITGFNKGMAEEYIEHCIPGIRTSYPTTLEYMLDKIGMFPLYIQQTLHYLVDRGALGIKRDFLYIASVSVFHEVLNSLPPKINDIIDRRWAVLKQSSEVQSYVDLLKIIVLFQKLPLFLIPKLSLSYDGLSSLISFGILERTSSEHIVFHHSQLLRFFDDVFFRSGWEDEMASRVCLFIEKEDLIHSYPSQYFIAKNSLNPSDKATLEFGISCLLNDDVTKELRTNFALRLYRSLNARPDLEKSMSLIRVYTKICDEVKTNVTFSKAMELFTDVYERKYQYHSRYVQFGDDYFYFILRYSNSFLSLHDDPKAHVVLLKALSVIDEFIFADEKGKKKAKAALLNRLCVTYKSMNEPELAENAVGQALELSMEIDDKATVIKNYIDKGYIYYKNRDRVESLLECWDMAWKIYNDHYNEKISQRTVSAYYHRSLCELIRSDLPKAWEYSIKALSAADRGMDTFNKIKILLVRAIILHLEDPKRNNEQVSNMANTCIDLCARHSSFRSYWTSWHLLGKISMDRQMRLNAYLVALEQLKSFVHDKKTEAMYRYFFDDFAISLRRIGVSAKEVESELKQFILDPANRKRVTSILNQNAEEFKVFTESFRPITPINDKKSNYPCP